MSVLTILIGRVAKSGIISSDITLYGMPPYTRTGRLLITFYLTLRARISIV